jgi:hypothetical protein
LFVNYLVGKLVAFCGETNNVCNIIAMVFERVVIAPTTSPIVPYIQMSHVVGYLLKWLLMHLNTLALKWFELMLLPIELS